MTIKAQDADAIVGMAECSEQVNRSANLPGEAAAQSISNADADEGISQTLISHILITRQIYGNPPFYMNRHNVLLLLWGLRFIIRLPNNLRGSTHNTTTSWQIPRSS